MDETSGFPFALSLTVLFIAGQPPGTLLLAEGFSSL
jgi:hypothetical protein